MKIDRRVLMRYFTGECSVCEKELIRQWLTHDERNKNLFIRERIHFDASVISDEHAVIDPSCKSEKKYIRYIIKTASVLLIFIGSSYLFHVYHQNLNISSMQTIYVPPGSRSCITLPDGSQVWLNANTKFKYLGNFMKERVVELNGEAYFDVAKNENRPFVVKTDKYHIEVLGTSFNLEAYSDQPTFETALFTGHIKLYKAEDIEDTFYLHAGETALLIDNNLKIKATGEDKYRWKDGLIVIDEKSFEEIMLLLEKYFMVDIIIKSEKVKTLGYRGTFRIDDGIDHCLRVLQKDFHFNYKRENGEIYIY